MAAQPFQPLPRRRLIGALLDARLALLEAGSGYGKSVVIGQVRDALGVATLDVALGPRDGTVAGLLARLRGAAARSRLSDLLAAIPGTPGPGGLDELVLALHARSEPCLLLIDDVHLLDEDAAALLADVVGSVPSPHRSILAGRMLPERLSRLRATPGAVVLDADDLRLDAAETADLLRERFGLAVDPATASRARDNTGGWATAVMLLGSRAERSMAADPLSDALARDATWAGMLSDAFEALGRDAIEALGHLARLSTITVDRATAIGFPDLMARAAAAGFPVSVRRDGSWLLPGPVLDALIDAVALRPALTERLAGQLTADGETLDALRLLIDVGSHGAAAAVLATLSPERVLRLDFEELRRLVDGIAPDVLDAHAGALVQLARAGEPPGRFELRREVLARAVASSSAREDPKLQRAIHAEQARDLVRDGAHDAADAIAQAIIASTGPDEPLTRARALDVHGRCLAWRRDSASLRRAGTVMSDAMDLCRRQRQEQWASQVALPLAIEAQHGIGRSEDALRTLDEAMRPLPARSHQRALILTFRAQILNDVGRADEAAADIGEALGTAEVLRDPRIVAYASWEAARTAALRGERAEAVAALARVERYAGDWFEHGSGATFLAVAAEVSIAVGATESAFAYLGRALERREESVAPVDLATAAVHARVGDPAVALEALDRAAASGRLWPRDGWRVGLFRALALHRRDGDASDAIRGAFAEAERAGVPHLPLLREGDIARRLHAVLAAGERGSVMSGPTPEDVGLLHVQALGDLVLRRGNQPVLPPVGRACDVLRILVATRGRIAADELTHLLWPDEDTADLRTRLRNVLTRTRESLGPIVMRDGDAVVLSGVEVDAWHFEDEARSMSARSAGDAERSRLARTAIGRYRGDLFAGDRDATWVIAPREGLRRMSRRCLDVLVDESDARNDVDESLRLLERVMEIDADDELTYLRAAELLLAQGRIGAARAMLGRARALIVELGVPVPAALAALDARVAPA